MSTVLNTVQKRWNLRTLTSIATTASVVVTVLGVIMLIMSRIGDFAYFGSLGFSAIVTGLGLVGLGVAGLALTAALDTVATRLLQLELPAPPVPTVPPSLAPTVSPPPVPSR